ncbi:MAG TPA: hypothetical protein PKG67_01245 [Turneriella sp.]|nr:hypothetical protein [Turneriella sp.]
MQLSKVLVLSTHVTLAQLTPTPVTFAAFTVPEPLETVQVCPTGWVSTVTL